MVKHSVTTNLINFKHDMWEENLGGMFSFNGRYLSDIEVRKLIDYAINHGYVYSSDIPAHVVESVIDGIKK